MTIVQMTLFSGTRLPYGPAQPRGLSLARSWLGREGDDMRFRADLIEQTFSRVTPIADDVAVFFYERLFASHPEVRDLFAWTDMQMQRRMLLSALGAAVESAHTLDALIPTLRDLGRRHVAYGVEARHYPLVGEALLSTLEHFLGREWNDELRQTWAEFYGRVATSMMEGAKGAVSRTPVAVGA